MAKIAEAEHKKRFQLRSIDEIKFTTKDNEELAENVEYEDEEEETKNEEPVIHQERPRDSKGRWISNKDSQL